MAGACDGKWLFQFLSRRTIRVKSAFRYISSWRTSTRTMVEDGPIFLQPSAAVKGVVPIQTEKNRGRLLYHDVKQAAPVLRSPLVLVRLSGSVEHPLPKDDVANQFTHVEDDVRPLHIVKSPHGTQGFRGLVEHLGRRAIRSVSREAVEKGVIVQRFGGEVLHHEAPPHVVIEQRYGQQDRYMARRALEGVDLPLKQFFASFGVDVGVQRIPDRHAPGRATLWTFGFDWSFVRHEALPLIEVDGRQPSVHRMTWPSGQLSRERP